MVIRPHSAILVAVTAGLLCCGAMAFSNSAVIKVGLGANMRSCRGSQLSMMLTPGSVAPIEGPGSCSMRTSSGAFNHRPSFSANSPILRPLISSGGGNGGGIRRGGGGGGGGGGDDNERLPPEIIALLGSTKLPQELLEAVKAGRIGAKEIANWLNIQKNPLLRWISDIAEPMKLRLVANDRFFMTLAIELMVGCTMKMIAEVTERQKRNAFWNELDFVASDMALEFLGDFALVFLLAPAAAIAAPRTAGVAGAFSKLPGFFMQEGAFSPAQRLACFVSKAITFWFIGFLTSVAGHSTTKALIELRGKSTSHLAPVLDNSIQWGNFLAVSSNTRYQIISGLEARVYPYVLGGFWGQTVGTLAVRLSNCFVGGIQWLWWARVMGLQ